MITATVIRSDEDAYRISVEQRDKTGLIPDSVKENPLMNKLRVGRADDEFEDDERDSLRDEEEDEDFYGPRPAAYGPEIPLRVQPAGYEEPKDVGR